MRLIILSLVALAASLLPSGCETSRADNPSHSNSFRTYASTDGGQVHSTLAVAREPGLQHLSSITQLSDGTCLAEDATTDGAGRLLRAEASLAAPVTGQYNKVRFDPQHGAVDVSTPSLQIHWTVPTDLPWVWTPLLNEITSGQSIATPLSALVAMHAASSGSAVRSLDVANFQSHTIMTDQLLVPERDSVTVVLGDDAAELTGGLPQRIHLAALGRELQALDEQPGWKTALATFVCAARDGSRTL